jgi:hypothetical protein
MVASDSLMAENAGKERFPNKLGTRNERTHECPWYFCDFIRFSNRRRNTRSIPCLAPTAQPCRLMCPSCPPRVPLMPASHRLTSGLRPHHFGPPARPFYGIHKVLQRVRFASEDPPVLPFDWIQFHLTCVDLDRRTSSVAWTPAASEIYLAHRRHRDTHFRFNLGLSMRLSMILILKISYSHFKLTSRRRTTSYDASQPAVIILR